MRCPRLPLPDLVPDGALVGRERLAAGDLLGDHRAHRVVDRSGRGEATPVIPSAQLQTADRDGGLGGGPFRRIVMLMIRFCAPPMIVSPPRSSTGSVRSPHPRSGRSAPPP